MGLETATYVSGLVNTNPLGSDGRSVGDDHIRLVKSVLQNTFPNANGAINPTPTEFNALTGATAVATISGNTILVAADFNYQGALSKITAGAVITLPAVSGVTAGKRRRFRSGTTGDVTLVRVGADTIDGATSYRIPSFTLVEITSDGTSEWMVTVTPSSRVGDLTPSGKASADPGEVAADGAAISRTTYAGLFAVLGTTFGAGDGSTTFNVPDTRARALVGSGAGTLAEVTGAVNVNTTNDTFDVALNDDTWITGMKVQISTSGSMPAPLVVATDYWVIRASTTTIKFATTLANALAGTAIDITTQGTGNHTTTHTLRTRTRGQKMGAEEHPIKDAEMRAHTHGLTDPGHAHNERGRNTPSGSGATIVETAISALADELTQNTTTTSTTGITIASFGGDTAHNNVPSSLGVPYFIKT